MFWRHEAAFLAHSRRTNHLDIDSIAAVEAGLQAYDGALLIVSHDEVFLDAVGMTRRLEFPIGELHIKAR